MRPPIQLTLLSLVASLLAGCATGAGQGPPTEPSPRSAPSVQEVPTTTCDDPPPQLEIVCESVALVHQHYVDPVPEARLAQGAERGVRQAAAPDPPLSALPCPLPAPRFLAMCEAMADRRLTGEAGAEAAVEGMVASALDPNSAYLDPVTLDLVEEEQSGRVEGIGAFVTLRTGHDGSPCRVVSEWCRVVVAGVVDGGPAQTGGVRQGDRLVSVDGAGLLGRSVDEVTAMVRGEAGSEIVLGLARGGRQISLTITRADVPLPLVESEMVGETGYVRLASFGSGAAGAFHRALQGLLDHGAVRVLLDLRDNPGGTLTGAVSVASEFLAHGSVLRTEWPEDVRSYPVERGGVLSSSDVPVLVVVNQGSASASEVVAAVLQERGRALVLGEATFGKNTVQRRFPLSNGGALKLTVARWLTPEGFDFGDTGVIPDVEADLGPDLSRQDLVARAVALAGA